MNGLLDLLKKFSPLNEEEQVPERSPAMGSNMEQPTPSIAPISPAPVDAVPGLDASILEQYAQPRAANFVAPRISIPEEDSKAQKAREDRFKTDLEALKEQYQAAQEDARKRRMYGDMLAAVGNNVGNIVGGATAMNTKASVSPTKTAPINVRDSVDEVNKRFDKDYDNLLKQYKGLKGDGLSAKDRLYANISQAQLDSQAARLNANIENTDRNAGIRVGTARLKDQKDNELSDKQEKELSDFDTALASLSRTRDMKKGIDTGPVASLRNVMAKKAGWDDPKASALRAQIVNDLSERVKQLSGTAASDKEREALSFTLPSMSDNEGTFEELLNLAESRIREAKAIRENSIRRKQGKNVAGYKQPGDKAPQPKTVERKTKDGRIAIFDADTKQFLKYKE